MNKLIDFFNANKKYILGSVLVIGLILAFLLLKKEDKKMPIVNETIAISEEKEEKKDESFYVDVKGAVSKPGVYQVTNEMIINDVLVLAKLKKSATTKNINLSKSLSPGMVIYISTNNELAKETVKYIYLESECSCDKVNITECVVDSKSVITDGESADNKISLNTATREELMTLTGIGEAKADDIIEYRQTNGEFKTIEDIMNVSGIGEAVFAKIKENITI